MTIKPTANNTSTPSSYDFSSKTTYQGILGITTALFVSGVCALSCTKESLSSLLEKTIVVGICAAFYLLFDSKKQPETCINITKNSQPTEIQDHSIEESSDPIAIKEALPPEIQDTPPIEESSGPLSPIKSPTKTKVLEELSYYFKSSEAPLTQEEHEARKKLRITEDAFKKIAPGLRAFLCKTPYALGKKLEEKNLSLKDFLTMSHLGRYKLLISQKSPSVTVSRERVSKAVGDIEDKLAKNKKLSSPVSRS